MKLTALLFTVGLAAHLVFLTPAEAQEGESLTASANIEQLEFTADVDTALGSLIEGSFTVTEELEGELRASVEGGEAFWGAQSRAEVTQDGGVTYNDPPAVNRLYVVDCDDGVLEVYTIINGQGVLVATGQCHGNWTVDVWL